MVALPNGSIRLTGSSVAEDLKSPLPLEFYDVLAGDSEALIRVQTGEMVHGYRYFGDLDDLPVPSLKGSRSAAAGG